MRAEHILLVSPSGLVIERIILYTINQSASETSMAINKEHQSMGRQTTIDSILFCPSVAICSAKYE